MIKEFTVEEFCQAAEKAKLPNYNQGYIQYLVAGDTIDDDYEWIKSAKESGEKSKIVQTCVIGEAFLNLGMVPNGTTPMALSDALRVIEPDDGEIDLGEDIGIFYNLSDFINNLNDVPGWKGKKRMAKNIRKYFSKSLDTKIKLQVR